MNITPEIPQLDPIRVQVRKHALMNEIARKPSRPGWRVAVPATALTAAVAIGAAWWTVPAPPPDPPSPGESRAVVEKCELSIQRIRRPADHPAFGPLDSSAVDRRGDMALVMLTGPEDMWICMYDGDSQVGNGGFSRADNTKFVSYRRDVGEDRPSRVIGAAIRPDARSMRVDTADGKRVTATLDRGWATAWWLSDAEATLVTLYDEAGHVLETAVPENR